MPSLGWSCHRCALRGRPCNGCALTGRALTGRAVLADKEGGLAFRRKSGPGGAQINAGRLAGVDAIIHQPAPSKKFACMINKWHGDYATEAQPRSACSINTALWPGCSPELAVALWKALGSMLRWAPCCDAVDGAGGGAGLHVALRKRLLLQRCNMEPSGARRGGGSRLWPVPRHAYHRTFRVWCRTRDVAASRVRQLEACG